jgi:PAS domain S-box-containing protein
MRALEEKRRAEEALRESEQRLKEAQRLGKIGHWEFDLETCRLRWSDMVFAIYERDPKLGPPTEEEEANYYAPEDAKRLRDLANTSIKTGKPYETDVSLRLPSGRITEVVVIGTPVKDSQGRTVRLLGTVQDITERKLIEAALRTSEERHRTLFETMQQGVVYQDADGLITHANPAAERILGLTLGQMQGRTSMDPRWRSIHEDGSEFPGQEHPAMVALRTGKPVTDVIMGVFNPADEGYHWIVVSAMPQFRANEAQPYQVFTTFTDITDRKRAEEAMRQSEELYRTLVESLPQKIFVKDRDSVYMTCNGNYARDLGIAVQEIAGKTDFDFFPRELAEKYRADDHRLIDSGVTEEIEEKYVKGGEEFWVNTVKTPIRDQQGNITGILGIFWDITERKQAEEALRLSEKRYRRLFERNVAGVYLTTLDGQLIDVNDAFVKILGYESREELLSHRAEDLYFHKTDREEFLSKLAKEKTIVDSELRLRRESGESVWVLENVSLIEEEDSPPLIFGTAIDITGRKQAEVALRGSEARLRRLIEGSNDIIYVLQDNRFVMVNSKFEELTGYSSEEASAPDFDFSDTYTPESKELVAERMRKRERGESVPDRYTFHILTKAGKVLDLETSVSQIEWEGKPATLGICRDMTEHLSLELQLHQAMKMEAVGRLAGGVAHDFNNLLTVIHGHAELAMMTVDPRDPLHNNVDEILKAAQRAAVLVRQLLAFSRKQPMEPKIIRLNDVLTDLNKMLRRIIGEDIDLQIGLEEELWTVKVDPGQMEQVIINLSVNARDAMPAGGMLMLETQNVQFDAEYVRTHTEASVGPYVMLAVSDNGTGMDEEVKKRIFEPFFTTKVEGKGTGLGLATVYGIVKQSGGFINVYSELGVGTTFKVYLPRVTGEAEDIKKKAKPAEAPRGTETILFVEDEEAVRVLSVMFLKRHGYTVMEASNGGEAYLKCKHLDKPVDLIITDVIMPGGMNGAELIQTIRSELWHNVKALYISGYTANAVFHNGVLDPGTPYLQKPFRLEDFGHKVREVLDGE